MKEYIAIVKVRLRLLAENSEGANEVLGEMDYNFTCSSLGDSDVILGTEIVGSELVSFQKVPS